MQEDLLPITTSLWGILAVEPNQPQLDEDDCLDYLEQKHGEDLVTAPRSQDVLETD